MSEDTCIYCRGTGTGAFFTSDHVVSQAFGLFGPETMTLNREVCGNCNQVLGREVETPAARGSLEGVHRFLVGLRNAESFLKTPRARVRFELDEPGWAGVEAYHVPSPDGDGARVMFEPQALLEDKRTGKPSSFTLTRLKALTEMHEEIGRIRLYARNDEEENALLAELDRLGINFRREGVAPPPGRDGAVRVKYAAVCDVLVSRLMAKIAFNYMAKQLGATFALKPEFDEIRRFIRYGQGAKDLVGHDTKPVLFDEIGRAGWTITRSHLVTIARGTAGGLVGEVSLFNLVRHRIVLARRNPEIIHLTTIPCGHRSLWDRHSIEPLVGWDSDNLVQPADVFRRRRR